MAPRAGILVLAGLSSLLGACWTSASAGEDLARRVGAIERGQAAQREELQQEITTAQTKVGELETVLEQATKVVTRASADTGAQVETLQQQVMALEGQLAELRNEVTRQQAQLAEQQGETDRQLKKLARHVGMDTTLEESEIPASADAHFMAGQQAYEQQQWGRARALFQAFIERHARDERVDDAMLRIGTSYLAQERPATALGELRKIISQHADGNVADAALLAMADAFYQLHACTDATAALNALIQAHARSPLVAQARTKLREIQRAPRGYCTS